MRAPATSRDALAEARTESVPLGRTRMLLGVAQARLDGPTSASTLDVTTETLWTPLPSTAR